ncbi:hypothetical protein BKA62DRAFT_817836 [Auriculariales sp. MPI-PUGE-AT-0066]|nr:hypothetical protein BKA62DRAFT_817836 [Auriculariales sp. MPI-PUGE-AT-0066]
MQNPNRACAKHARAKMRRRARAGGRGAPGFAEVWRTPARGEVAGVVAQRRADRFSPFNLQSCAFWHGYSTLSMDSRNEKAWGTDGMEHRYREHGFEGRGRYGAWVGANMVYRCGWLGAVRQRRAAAVDVEVEAAGGEEGVWRRMARTWHIKPITTLFALPGGSKHGAVRQRRAAAVDVEVEAAGGEEGVWRRMARTWHIKPITTLFALPGGSKHGLSLRLARGGAAAAGGGSRRRSRGGGGRQRLRWRPRRQRMGRRTHWQERKCVMHSNPRSGTGTGLPAGASEPLWASLSVTTATLLSLLVPFPVPLSMGLP